MRNALAAAALTALSPAAGAQYRNVRPLASSPARVSLPALSTNMNTAPLASMSAPLAAASALPAAAVPAGRLPEEARPLSYDLSLKLEPAAASFEGRVKIALDLAAPVETLTLNALDLRFTEVFFDGRRLDGSSLSVDEQAQTVTVRLDRPARKGRATLEFAWSGKMNELMRGLYKSRGRRDGQEEAWTFTHLEPTHARRVFPSFDQPDRKAKYRLTLDVPAGLTALSNTEAVSRETKDGRAITRFAWTPKMSSYVLAVYAARLEQVSRRVGQTLISVWAPADQMKLTSFALDVSAHALKALNRYFGLRYDLPKMDLVAAPDFAVGAMENWGAILFSERTLLVDPKLSSERVLRRAAEVIVHEWVHQWKGNRVTMKWWNDLWLNEAFATWLAAKIVAKWKPKWRIMDEYGQGKSLPLALDALPGAKPVRSDASTPDEIQAKFDHVSYDKGGAILRMIEGWIGERAFTRAMRAYMRRFEYKNAEAGDLARELEKASGKPVRSMMDGWLLQPGAPLVSASAGGPGRRTLTLAQSRFVPAGSPADGTLWTVPVSVRYRLKGERKTRVARVLLDGPRAELKLPGKGELLWAYPNAEEIGYLRLSLDDGLLGAALNARAELSPAERSGLLDHLWALTRAGRFPVARFLGSLALFKDDPSSLIIDEASGYLRALRRELAEDEPARAAIARYAAEFFGPHAERLGWSGPKREDLDGRLSRPTVLSALAFLAPESRIAAQIAPRLDSYLADDKSLDAALVPVVLGASARKNDPALFAELRRRLGPETAPEVRDHALRALSQFTAPELVEQALAMGLTPELRAQDAWKPYVWLLGAPETQARAWEFVKTHWAEILAKAGPRGATRVVEASGALISPEWRAEVESFFKDPKNEVPMARKALDQALQSIELGLRFRAAQRESFRDWLRVRTPR